MVVIVFIGILIVDPQKSSNCEMRNLFLDDVENQKDGKYETGREDDFYRA
jgi:hypothetical protein